VTGTVYLVGAGPGAVDLLTVRAVRLLERADVVLHDALVSAEVLALAPQARLFNVGKRAGRPSVDQRLIGRLLVRLGLRHSVVVRLKGGDPHVFGRASEEIAACRAAGIPVVSVPGVSAAFAGASALGVSLTQRGVSRSVTFVTPTVGKGQAQGSSWARAAAAAETAVVYMGAKQAEGVRNSLLALGVPALRPVAFIENASCADERIVAGTLEDLAALSAQLGAGPALLVIGEVARSASGVRDVAQAA
jgi:uroporphyrin-III C-methyltransferase